MAHVTRKRGWLRQLQGEEVLEIRTIRESDAEAYLYLRKQTLQETRFLLREPDELETTVEQMREEIHDISVQGHHLMLVAEQDGQLIGFLGGTRGEFKRNRHNLYIVIGILQAFTGQGIGTKLFMAMEDWACQRGITRLDLTVMAHNQAGIALYKKQGFAIEGTKRRSLLVNGNYVDEYIMAKILE